MHLMVVELHLNEGQPQSASTTNSICSQASTVHRATGFFCNEPAASSGLQVEDTALLAKPATGNMIAIEAIILPQLPVFTIKQS